VHQLAQWSQLSSTARNLAATSRAQTGDAPLAKVESVETWMCFAKYFLGCLVALSDYTLCSMITWGCQLVQELVTRISEASAAPSDEHG